MPRSLTACDKVRGAAGLLFSGDDGKTFTHKMPM